MSWSWRLHHLALALLFVNLALRVVTVMLTPPPPRRSPLRTMVVLGSGGHTAEMFAILRALDPGRYRPRQYVIAATDSTSAAKVLRHEEALAATTHPPACTAMHPEEADGTAVPLTTDGASEGACYDITYIPRSREVGQRYVTSVVTTLRALAFGFVAVFVKRPHVVLCNG